MSLHQLAQQIQASGRGNDTQLVHMAPAEVRSLRKLAQQHGGDLSINPKTGLPEAGFLEQILPTVVGAGVGIATGNPMLGAAAGGALGMAMNKGSIQSGLMAGLGAYGMGSLGAGLMETGASAALGSAVEAGAGPSLSAQQLAANADAGLVGAGANAGQTTAQATQAFNAANPVAETSNWDKLQAGYKGTKFDMDFLKKNMFPIGAAAAPLLMGASSLSGQNQNQASNNPGMIRPSTYSQIANPRYGEPGQAQMIQKYTAQEPIAASDFGSRPIYMAEGGIAELAGAEEQRARAMQAAPPAAQQPSYPAYAPPPVIQPQMAEIQQRYTAPQRQAPAAFQYEAPSFTKYGASAAGSGAAGSGAAGSGAAGSGAAGSGAAGASANGLDASGIDALYQQYLGRSADPTGLNVNKGQSADVVKQAILASPEYKTNNPSGSIGSIYQELLGRAPDPTGIAANAGQSEETIRQSILASPEYLARYPAYNNPVYDYGNDYVSTGDGGAAGEGDSGPFANGGLMQSYAVGGGIGGYYASPDDGNRNFGGIGGLNQGPQYPMQGVGYAMGGQLGSYSDGGQLLRGPGDGVSDDIPAQIGDKQPARLADGEFVVPARIVSELGNGSTDAGAKRLYAMMDRVQKNRSKTIGKNKVAVNSRSDRYLPA